MTILVVAGVCVSTIGVGAAAIVLPPVPEQLVEGHTVFTVIQPFGEKDEYQEEYAAAVAVLVREFNGSVMQRRFPGVLWFNDQYLINPDVSNPQTSGSGQSAFRYPCTGAVLAVNQGGPDPRTLSLTDANYNESYRIKDPNNNVWMIDKWTPEVSPGVNVTVWAVSMKGLTGDPKRSTPDDGKDCKAYVDGAPKKSPGDENGQGYPCQGCSGLEYNALLLMRLQDLTVPATAKNHAAGSTDRTTDISACHDTPRYRTGVNVWPCPSGDDDREGNSHPYNPDTGPYDGVNNHGSSADCTGDGANDTNCHATRRIDIYYGTAPVPTTRKYPMVWRDEAKTTSIYYEDATGDSLGKSAPYHGH